MEKQHDATKTDLLETKVGVGGAFVFHTHGYKVQWCVDTGEKAQLALTHEKYAMVPTLPFHARNHPGDITHRGDGPIGR